MYRFVVLFVTVLEFHTLQRVKYCRLVIQPGDCSILSLDLLGVSFCCVVRDCIGIPHIATGQILKVSNCARRLLNFEFGSIRCIVLLWCS